PRGTERPARRAATPWIDGAAPASAGSGEPAGHSRDSDEPQLSAPAERTAALDVRHGLEAEPRGIQGVARLCTRARRLAGGPQGPRPVTQAGTARGPCRDLLVLRRRDQQQLPDPLLRHPAAALANVRHQPALVPSGLPARSE